MPLPESPVENHTCVLTIQADRPGGIPTVVDWWHMFLAGWGQQPTTLYATFDDADISRRERLQQTLAQRHVHPRPEHPNPTLAVAASPLPLWLFFAVPQFLVGSVINRFDQHVVAGGPCFAGLPLALRGIPYIVWMGTLYEDELRGKMLIGDQWAESVLKNRFWPVLAWQEKLVLRRAAAVLAQSPYTLRRIIETVPEIGGRAELALVPIDTQRFKPLPNGKRPSKRHVLNVSRINDPRKNIALLLRAFALVQKDHSEVRLVLAGDDPQPPLLDLCVELGISEAVDFKGKVSADELVALYQGAELFVISSTQEGLGIVMLEAMACGAPVIATDCGGPEEIVISGRTGQIVPNDDEAAMAQAISGLLDDPKTVQTMRDNCAAFIQEHASRQVVEETLYRRFAQAFPESVAASKSLYPMPPLQPGRSAQWWPLTLGAVWAAVVLAAFLIHQIPLHWTAVQTQIVNPLLDALQ